MSCCIFIRIIMSLREKYLVRTLIVLVVVIELSLVVLIYTISGVKGQISWPDITISDAIIDDPSRSIGAFLIPMSAFCILLVIGLRLRRIESLLRVDRDVWIWYFTWITLVGMFLGRTGVAAVSLDSQYALHAVAAAFVYIFGICMYTSITIMDDAVGLDRDQSLRYMRIGICVCMWPILVAGGITVNWVNGAFSILELTLAVLFLDYFITFYFKSEFDMKSTYGPVPTAEESIPDIPPIPPLYQILFLFTVVDM